MPNYGITLEKYLCNVNYKISFASICHLGVQIIRIFEQIHASGYVYNDLKPDNIMLGSIEDLPQTYTKGNCFKNASIKLVDFGYSTKYIDKSGHLKKKKKLERFNGNTAFASIN